MKPLSALSGFLLAETSLLALASQIPFHATTDQNTTSIINASGGRWSFEEAPSANATENYVFETVSTLLQQWANTRYRNGHSIVPVTIPVNTLLYHGTWHKEIPSVPEWVATDPEHSYLFCRTAEAEKGCWQLTLAVTRPLNVLYFDGSSAAKMQGCMDAQDTIVWGHVEPNRVFDERNRILDFCAWGKKYNLDGYMRMEPNFEIMLCGFSEGVEVASFLNLVARRGMGGPPPPRKNITGLEDDDRDSRLLDTYRVIESGHTHNRFPGETRAQLDLTRLISFYDTDMFPNLIESRFGQERYFHRTEAVGEEGRQRLLRRLDEVLTSPQPPGSGVDWTTLIRVVKHRYADRLEVLQYMLNKTEDAGQTIREVHTYIQSMMSPYILNGVRPDDSSSTSIEWASPIFEECATTHTRTVRKTLHSRLTYSEGLIADAVDGTLHEICRVLVGIWADGVVKLELPASSVSDPGSVTADWGSRITNLIQWLDWSEWVKCRPECGPEETCYLPTWPWLHGAEFPRGPRKPPPPGEKPPQKPGASSLEDPSFKWDRMWGWVKDFTLGEDDEDYWRRPQPKCIRKVFPFDDI